jgi:hypothetical protein
MGVVLAPKVEIFYVALDEDAVSFSIDYIDLDGRDENPTSLVADNFFSRFPSVRREEAIVHSTSWRYSVNENRVILTFLAYASDPALRAGAENRIPLQNLLVTQSNDALDPSAVPLDLRNVLSHAIRHLAYLSFSDQAVKTALAKNPKAFKVIQSLDNSGQNAAYEMASYLGLPRVDS